MSVVVIGAGAIGGCVAYRLAQAGTPVTLVDGAADPATGLSGHSFGWANAVRDGSAPYYELTLAALAAHHRLAAELGAPEWLFAHGNLHWADSTTGRDRLLAEAEDYRRRGYPVTELSTTDVSRDLEPELDFTAAVGPVVFYPQDAYVLGDRLVTTARACAADAGAKVLLGDPVVGLLDDAPRSGVRLRSGERIAADTVICCAGRANAELLATVGATLPLVEPDDPGRTIRGLLVRTTPVRRPVRRVVHAPGLSIRPHTGGRLVLHCHDVDETLTAVTPAERVAATVLDRLPAVLPGAAGAEVESAYLGVRPMPRDGMSILGPVPGAEGVYVVATHSGITLAAVLAEIVATEVLGEPHPLAAAFRPDRFVAVP